MQLPYQRCTVQALSPSFTVQVLPHSRLMPTAVNATLTHELFMRLRKQEEGTYGRAASNTKRGRDRKAGAQSSATLTCEMTTFLQDEEETQPTMQIQCELYD
ncbi:hypothetical protein TRVL_09168 [Trypanosoma vivax]|uniref:Uncharacterized protein n=1 Tax=Trypanosoma vivax (strain Y486) TaxID=1055687 RepID=G0UC91_TRYVY|nr:hypothetical protein TRVL_09168 [Trypanosoma vivax]CCC53441.1 hypothetical protein, unlikely [Trypanosoma vivax Y486]